MQHTNHKLAFEPSATFRFRNIYMHYIYLFICIFRDGIAQTVSRLTTDWTVRRSNPGGGRDFPLSSSLALGPTPPPIKCVSRGLNRPGRGLNHPPPCSAEVKERLELCLYSPSCSSCQVKGWTLRLTLGVYFLCCICVFGRAEIIRTVKWLGTGLPSKCGFSAAAGCQSSPLCFNRQLTPPRGLWGRSQNVASFNSAVCMHLYGVALKYT